MGNKIISGGIESFEIHTEVTATKLMPLKEVKMCIYLPQKTHSAIFKVRHF